MQRIRKILVLLTTIMMLWGSILSVEASSFRFKVTAEKEEVKAGEIVKLNLQVSEIDVKEGINVLEADLQYDETVFEKVTFQDNNEWNSTYQSEEGDQKGKILFAKAVEGVKQEEKIGEIQLKLKNNVKETETEIQINNITSNDGKQLIEEKSKSVKIKIEDQEKEPEQDDKKDPEQGDKKDPEQSDKKDPEQGDKKDPEQSDKKDPEQNKEKDETEKLEQDLIKTTYEQKNKGSAKEEESTKTGETIGEDIKTGDGIVLLTIAVIVLIAINVIYFIIKSRQLGKTYRKRMLILVVISLVLITVVVFLAKDVLAFEGKELEEMIQILKSENKNNPESTEYLVTDQTISRIKPGTTTGVVKSKLENVTIVDSTDAESVKTGMTAKYEANGRMYEISVLGDINGDGILNQIELTRVIREYLKCENWRIEKEIERRSADVTCDGKIDEKDVSSIINYIMYGKLEAKGVEPVIAPKVEVIEGKKTEEESYVARATVKITQQNAEDKTQKTIYEITGSKKTEETIITDNEAVIELTGAGVYKITGYTYGKDGNKSKGSDLIVVIEELPEIEVSTQEWTNENVEVSIKEKEGYAIEYKINEGEWKKYEDKLEVKENCTITARFVNLTNEADKSKSVTTQIANIDSKIPTEK